MSEQKELSFDHTSLFSTQCTTINCSKCVALLVWFSCKKADEEGLRTETFWIIIVNIIITLLQHL